MDGVASDALLACSTRFCYHSMLGQVSFSAVRVIAEHAVQVDQIMVLAVPPPSTPAMIDVYQGITIAILLTFAFLDVNTATAYALMVFGAYLIKSIILGVWDLKRTTIKISKLSQGSFEEKEL